MKPNGKSRIIVALDTSNPENALNLAKRVLPLVGLVKIGLEFIHSMRANLLVTSSAKAIAYLELYREFYDLVKGRQFEDVKLDDIPNTVGAASNEVGALNPKFFNVHASAGIPAMKKAVVNRNASLVLAVTVLTSKSSEDSESTFGASAKAKVIQFAREAVLAGCDGIVCSSEELVLLRDKDKYPELQDLITVVPGIRPTWAAKGDQQRIMTPGHAVKAGADYLVIGRPILAPPPEIGPMETRVEEAIRLITEEIEEAEKMKKS